MKQEGLKIIQTDTRRESAVTPLLMGSNTIRQILQEAGIVIDPADTRTTDEIVGAHLRGELAIKSATGVAEHKPDPSNSPHFIKYGGI